MTPLVWRLARAGVLTALCAGLVGMALERARFGPDEASAVARVEADLRRRFDDTARELGALAAPLAADRATLAAARQDPAATGRLFAQLDAAIPDEDTGRTGITVYGPDATPLAWAGRVSELPRDRIDGPSALFVNRTALGPSLVRIEPVTSPDVRGTPRLAVIVVEQVLGRSEGTPGLDDAFVFSTSLAPVTLRASYGDTATHGPNGFVITAPGGGRLVDAEVKPGDLQQARRHWRDQVRAAVLGVLALTLLLCAGPLLDRRVRAATAGAAAADTALLLGLLAGSRMLAWFAVTPLVSGRRATTAPDLLFNGLLAAAVTWVLVDLIERWRVSRLRPRVGSPGALRAVVAFAAAGAATTWLLQTYASLLGRVVSGTALDVLHFSLHPLNAQRLAVAFGLLMLHAAAIWLAVAVVRVAAVTVRGSARGAGWAPAGAWVGAAGLTVWLLAGVSTRTTAGPLAAALTVVGLLALGVTRAHARLRRATQAARLTAYLLALVLPAMAMYPSLLSFAVAAKEQLVAETYAPLAISQRQELQDRLRRSLEEIDGLTSLGEVVAPATGTGDSASDRAFLIWSQTDLARFRLTSAVELYDAEGRLLSRFALNLPDYTTASHEDSGCAWDLLEEVSPFGSSERHILRASRGICDGRRQEGSVVVRVMLDYRTLPFISAQSPYLESLQPSALGASEGAAGRDVEFAVYGWSRAPLFTSGTSVWPISDGLFDRMVQSRAPFWVTLQGDAGVVYRVRFANDRNGIYALGFPVITPFGHVVNLAELITLTAVLYVVLLVLATLAGALALRAPASGRALLREVRSSFYRKLFLAFVAAAVVPVVILALATRVFFAAQSRAGVEQAAAQTATVAQRLVEDYATLQQRGAGGLDTLDDQIMVLVSRAIDQDVNLFDRTRLQATSERDLFASRLLPTRTPGDVFKAIIIDHLPTYVSVENVGEVRYLVAAAPVRAGNREGIVTVPVTLRAQETERRIDELDRRVLFAAVLFSLLGAGLGYWMAERIADPVNRLTRATRRIARGDLDARIAATSSDELRRLVEDFNSMAADLKNQRRELERTQRLDAWADMARQVAHDIKNPLTPIQLSAEHMRRVNADRGRPLSPVLDDCVTAILSQVAFLRQISSEFSSFASQPTPRPEPADVAALLSEVVDPYRTGLSGAGRVRMELVTPATLPQAMIDRTLFARALTNVIENALHAMPSGGVVTISAFPRPEPPGAIVVDVSDTGVGMDEEALSRIFEPYFSTKVTGTGLGLTIAKRNVELNGGTIAVRSTRGQGTTVTLTIPTLP